jgi:hypothetical protein
VFFHSHIWNLLWLLFELISCLSEFWVAETNTSFINVMTIWYLIVIIWFRLSEIFEYFVEWNVHWTFPESVEQFHAWWPIFLMVDLMLSLESAIRACQLHTSREPYCYSWWCSVAPRCNVPEATSVCHPQHCWCNNWFLFGLSWKWRTELEILWIDW